MEVTRFIKDPLSLVFTILSVPLLILIMGSIMGSNYGWGDEYTIFEIMVPRLLAYGSILTIYYVAASVASERELGLQRRINTTPLTSPEYMIKINILYD